MANTNELGRAPLTLAHSFEPPMLWIEEAANSGAFHVSDLPLRSFRATFGVGENLPTAQIEIALGHMPGRTLPPPPSPGEDTYPRDWQIFIEGQYKNPDAVFGDGRRIQIKTQRSEPSTDWCIFEGFVERVQRGWDANNRDVRWLTLYCKSTIIAADRMLSQFIIGQWRRSARSENALYITGIAPDQQETRECVRVTALPAVFNPGGIYNCHPTPLKFAGDGPNGIVYTFCDADHKRRSWPPFAQPETAQPWTVARMLRYIQWAALQPEITRDAVEPAFAYDVPRYSDPLGPSALVWDNTFRLAHVKANYATAEAGGQQLQVGPNLSELIEPYLERTDNGDPNDPQAQAMLRRPSDVVIDRMSVLEAFTAVCDRAGILFAVEHDIDTSGNVWTFLRFSVRGDRDVHGGLSGDSEPPGASTPGSGESYPGGSLVNPIFRDLSGTRSPTTRGVYLYCSSDRLDNPAGAAPIPFATAALARDSAFNGMLTQDFASLRNKAIVFGDPTQYEVTVPLLPGWAPNARWDINSGDPATVTAAIEYSRSSAFELEFGSGSLTAKNVGRWWVLNEDGFFEASHYRRAFGPWNQDSHWEPFKWATAGGIFELQRRGDLYWSVRRRKFLPLLARDVQDGRWIEPFVQFSFDGGNSWQHAGFCGADVQLDTDRCAVYVSTASLRGIARRDVAGLNYAEAYISGLLRVRVIANVQGDDSLECWSRPTGAPTYRLPWTEVVSRQGQLPRNLRSKPGFPTVPASTTDEFFLSYANQAFGENDDATDEATRLATRTAIELATPRVSGQGIVPWLWRNLRGLVAGYRVGDEVIGLQTQSDRSAWNFSMGGDPRFCMPRIVGISYAWSETEQSTTLILEDDAVSFADIAGSPAVIGLGEPGRLNRQQINSGMVGR